MKKVLMRRILIKKNIFKDTLMVKLIFKAYKKTVFPIYVPKTAHERYQNLSEEEKQKKCQYGREQI